MMQEFLQNSYLFGSNMPFIEELYDLYLEDPALVDEEWRSFFDKLAASPGFVARDVPHYAVIEAFAQRAKMSPALYAGASPAVLDEKQLGVIKLVEAYRLLGNRLAKTDPLNMRVLPNIPELDPKSHGLSDNDMEATFVTDIPGLEKATLRQIIAGLKETYCGHLTIEYMHISSTEEREWLRQRFEGSKAKTAYTKEQKRHILEKTVAAEQLEKYLATKYVGQKRFSLEGGEALIPLVDQLIQHSGALGVKETVIGMAHRGRLNVLINILGKQPADLFAEFEGKHADDLSAGDVKYHQGFSSDINTPGGPTHLTLAFNPSHLEIVNPVVVGSVRARQERRGDQTGKQVLPILIHGDSAFGGQGVIMETFQLSQTRGYGVGGTYHIIVNNQVGFTTSDPRDIRSTYYCSDIAKFIEAPIFHVNGDDPEAVVYATTLAMDFRQQFGKDVVIDLVCFRKLGHNEQDEPLVTQPFMYSLVKKHPGTVKVYAERLIAEGSITAEDKTAIEKAYKENLDQGKSDMPILSDFKRSFAVDWTPYLKKDWTSQADTRVSKEDLQRLSEKITNVPDGFKLHSRVAKIIEDRKAMGRGEKSLDWGMAESLAFASLLQEGYGVRISGQDSGRGTFFHRHAVLHDQNRKDPFDGTHIPLQHVAENQPKFTVIDSILSEEGVLGFEYGFTTAEPQSLTIWEGQFGDFANGAQVVIDQFISAGETKWGRLCHLTMMLPHGYEGQGPEHSSARLERYLQLCAEYNMQVVVPSTPAQVFHMLRRQMVRPIRKPLVVMWPKSLLRLEASASSLDELATGTFQTIIDDSSVNVADVKRVVVCSGKVYYELLAERAKRGISNIALVRLEQIYPFPHEEYAEVVAKYTNATEIVWTQEEPRNQGAWHRIRHYLERPLGNGKTLDYAGRDSSASPAVGYPAKHKAQQESLINQALTVK